MTANHQDPKSQSPERRLKLAAAALPVFAAIAYPIGFFLLNLVCSIWGFTDFYVLHVQCFFIVLWTAMMMVGWSLPVLLILSFEGNPTSKWLLRLINRKWAVGVLSILLVVVAVGLIWLVHHPDVIRSLVLQHLESIYFLIISGAGASGLFFPVGLIQDQKHKRIAEITLSEWLGGIMGVVFSTVFLSATYFFTPASWGGGIPQLKTYLVPPVAVPYLAPYNRSAQLAAAELANLPAGSAPPFKKIEGLSLIHEGSDRIVLLSEPCQKLLRLPKKWFEEEVMDVPKPNVPEIQKEVDTISKCPLDDDKPKIKGDGAGADTKSPQVTMQNVTPVKSPEQPQK